MQGSASPRVHIDMFLLLSLSTLPFSGSASSQVSVERRALSPASFLGRWCHAHCMLFPSGCLIRPLSIPFLHVFALCDAFSDRLVRNAVAARSARPGLLHLLFYFLHESRKGGVWKMSRARPVATPADSFSLSSLCVTLKAHASLWGVLRPCALCRRHPTGGGYSRLALLLGHPSHRLSAALPELRDRRCQSLRVFVTSPILT